MVMVLKDTYEDLTPERLAAIIDDFEAGKGAKIAAGPQVDRIFAAPASGVTTLRDKKAISKAERQRLAKEHAKEVAAKEAAKAAEAAPAAPAPAPVKPVAVVKAATPKAAKSAKTAPSPATPMAKVEAKPVATKAAHAKAASPATEKSPELLKKPRSGKGDDLKLIWGVGPKLEKMLNDMGVWHFDQIASWGKAELNWVDDRLEGFKGRASRDEWVKQSKKLAKGWRPDSAVGEKPV
jgi:NADH-quinone oxidoreductase subunit E